MIKTIAVVGCGISGAVLSAFLKKNSNINVDIYEKDLFDSKKINGIQISPNGTRILKKINFDNFNNQNLCKINEILIRDFNNPSYLARMSVSGYDSNYITLNRANLVSFIINEFELDKQVINKEVISIENNKLNFKETSSKEYDLIVLSDGIFSNIKANFLNRRFAYSGYNAVRGFFHLDESNKNNINLYMGSDYHIVFYPIDQNNNYSFTYITKSEESLLGNNYYENKKINFLEKNKFIVKYLPKEIFLQKEVYMWPIYKTNNFSFGKDKVICIGDSSHGFLPTRAQGACQAIEDSFILYNLIKNNCANSNNFFKERIQRISKIQKKSENSLKIFHFKNIFLRYFRNIFIKIICKSSLFSNFFNSFIFNYKYKL